MYNEMKAREKNMRALEHKNQTEMEEEQGSFASELSGTLLISLSLRPQPLARPMPIMRTMRRIKKSMASVKKRHDYSIHGRAYFSVNTTDYAVIGEQARIFEPFYDLWDCADRRVTKQQRDLVQWRAFWPRTRRRYSQLWALCCRNPE